MGTGGAVVAVLAGKFAELRPHLDERGWRLYLGSEARAYAAGEGCGLAAAVAVMAGAAGVSRATVMAGAGELAEGGRSRCRDGRGGRARAAGSWRRRHPGLRAALRDLLEASTRGDPMVAVTWTTLSLREIVRQMAAAGVSVREGRAGADDARRRLQPAGESRVIEGRQHPDRDAQFRHINAMIAAFRAAGDPVVSVDAKKKEQPGPYHRDGRAWRRKGDPVNVRDHDFPDAVLGKITPYGVCDITANTGFVSVGTSCGTAAFAVSALRLWWREQGAARYPQYGGCWSPATPGAPTATGPALERPAGAAGRGDRPGDHRVSFPARHPMPLLVSCKLSFRGQSAAGMMAGMHPWIGLSDDVRLGVLTEWVTADLVDEVLAECGRRDQRPGALPARFMVYYVLGLALFQQDSYDDVAENLVGALEGMDEAVPNRSSFTRARRRRRGPGRGRRRSR